MDGLAGDILFLVASWMKILTRQWCWLGIAGGDLTWIAFKYQARHRYNVKSSQAKMWRNVMVTNEPKGPRQLGRRDTAWGAAAISDVVRCLEKLSAIWEEEQMLQMHERWPEITPAWRASVFEQGVPCLGVVGAPLPLQADLTQLHSWLPGDLTAHINAQWCWKAETDQGGQSSNVLCQQCPPQRDAAFRSAHPKGQRSSDAEGDCV